MTPWKKGKLSVVELDERWFDGLPWKSVYIAMAWQSLGTALPLGSLLAPAMLAVKCLHESMNPLCRFGC